MLPDVATTYASSTLVVFVYMLTVFAIAIVRRDNSIVDVAWGPGFALIAATTFLLHSVSHSRMVLLVVLVALWGTRLAAHIFFRNKGKGEDFRYAAWRRSWGRMFYVRSFFFIYMLQGFLMLIIGYPIVLVGSIDQPALNFVDWIGAGVWFLGFGFEADGDYQLLLFKKNEANRGKVLRSGLWKYTRHPNYFGEAVLWWGLFLIASSSPHGWTAIISPLVITFLLLRISGVTMLEKKYSDNPEYEEYKRTTNAFFPWFPRR
ncbi:MAG: DUF1295 domain-containing protein [Ignavibacteria bacterium]|nr:DUF1295 domain-containing protein [Ignavibacteria bacterium]